MVKEFTYIAITKYKYYQMELVQYKKWQFGSAGFEFEHGICLEIVMNALQNFIDISTVTI